jgi:hypothetical protein
MGLPGARSDSRFWKLNFLHGNSLYWNGITRFFARASLHRSEIWKERVIDPDFGSGIGLAIGTDSTVFLTGISIL